MICIENVVLPSPEQWKVIIMGVRNPMNSWNKSDSVCIDFEDWDCSHGIPDGNGNVFVVGENDLDLMKRLRNAGTADHRKFMRMITVYVDITAPLYWWKEFDTYKVGTVTNSCSTMHKIHSKPFELDDFSHDHLTEKGLSTLKAMVTFLEETRFRYLDGKKKEDWYDLIQILPSSYNQKRTVMLNYEVLANIYKSRKNHKLDEWSIGFCGWIKTLPYSSVITGE